MAGVDAFPGPRRPRSVRGVLRSVAEVGPPLGADPVVQEFDKGGDRPAVVHGPGFHRRGPAACCAASVSNKSPAALPMIVGASLVPATETAMVPKVDAESPSSRSEIVEVAVTVF